MTVMERLRSNPDLANLSESEWSVLHRMADGQSYEEAYGAEMAALTALEDEADERRRKRRMPPGKPHPRAGEDIDRPSQGKAFSCESVGQHVLLGYSWIETAAAHGRSYAALNYWMTNNRMSAKKLKAAFRQGGVRAWRAMDEEIQAVEAMKRAGK